MPELRFPAEVFSPQSPLFLGVPSKKKGAFLDYLGGETISSETWKIHSPSLWIFPIFLSSQHLISDVSFFCCRSGKPCSHEIFCLATASKKFQLANQNQKPCGSLLLWKTPFRWQTNRKVFFHSFPLCLFPLVVNVEQSSPFPFFETRKVIVLLLVFVPKTA